MPINQVTGLLEEHIPELGVPRVQQKNAKIIKLAGQPRAVHQLSVAPGVSMQFYSKLSAAKDLVVLFTSPAPDGQTREASFREEIKALRSHDFALIVVDDATPQLHADIQKGWHLGGPTFDPIQIIAGLIPAAMNKSGAQRLIFAGREEGGYAALRASALFDDSYCIVDNPDVAINDSPPFKDVVNYFSKVWPEIDRMKLIRANRGRFSLVDLYRSTAPRNHVIYQQQLDDSARLYKHYRVFKNMYLVADATGSDITGKKTFRLYDTDFMLPSNSAASRFRTQIIESVATISGVVSHVR